jgi:hypothetical protein
VIISIFYDQIENELDDKTRNIINSFISKMDNNEYKEDKKKEIKLIIYNNQDKVTKDLEIIV